MANIVVVGAGVAGLTTALLLSRNPSYSITIVAKHMPGDNDIEYTSPWAGANYLPFSDKANSKWERSTWPELARLAKDVPEAGIHFQNVVLYNRQKDMQTASGQWLKDLVSTSPWFEDVVPDFKVLPSKDLPPVGQCAKNGVVLRYAVLTHITEAASLHHSGKKADIVVNCTGLLASKLGGVMDKDVIPIRGQIVHVRNNLGHMMSMSGTDDGEDEVCYIMERALGGGTVLGGTYQKGNLDSQPSPEQASRIMKRVVEICPKLTGGKGIEALDVIRHWVGFRPFRIGGARIEKEKINGCWVVHNYGHGGWGYQASYGCSEEAKSLVDSILSSQS